MSIANPLRDEEVDAWDVAYLGGVPNPGIVDVSGAGSPRKWDEAKGTGTSGASLRWTGDGLPEFTATVRVWEAEQLEEWNRTWGPLTARTEPEQKPKAFDWSHPATDDLKIRSVVVVDLSQWDQVDNGMWERAVKLKEYRAPKPVSLSKPAGAEGNGADGKTPTPKDEYDKKIEKLSDEIEKEAAK